MIESRTNRRLKDIRRLRHCKGDRAVLEGPHLVDEALAAGLSIESALATPAFLESAAGSDLAARLGQAPIEVAPALLKGLVDADSPQGLVAVVELPRGPVTELPRDADRVSVFADGLQDPGNLGALARVAEATGVAGLALSPGCAHPNHPRALRASAGSLLRLPVAHNCEPDALRAHLPESRWVALVPAGGTDLYEAALGPPLVLAVGAEGPGLSAEVEHAAELCVTIPVAGSVESLNSTVAAALVLYEIRRRAKPGLQAG